MPETKIVRLLFPDKAATPGGIQDGRAILVHNDNKNRIEHHVMFGVNGFLVERLIRAEQKMAEGDDPPPTVYEPDLQYLPHFMPMTSVAQVVYAREVPEVKAKKGKS